MTRYRRRLVVRRVDVDAVLTPVAQQIAAVRLQVADQGLPLHGADNSKGSRVTGWPPRDFSASSRLASNTSATASRRFSRASSKVSPWVLAPGNSSTNAM